MRSKGPLENVEFEVDGDSAEKTALQTA